MDEVKGCTSTGRRRITASLVSVVIGVGLLGACGSDDKPAASTPISTPITTVAGVTTTVAGATTTVAGGSTTTAAGSSTAPGTTTAAPGQYTVAKGDSLFAIAKKHCITIDVLVAANTWSDGINHVIHPGDVITIPAGACTVSTAAPSTTKAPTTTAGATTTAAAGSTTTAGRTTTTSKP
ncbi:MAG: LysM domain-containing protein [Ilumatobacteraceae bacterium]